MQGAVMLVVESDEIDRGLFSQRWSSQSSSGLSKHPPPVGHDPTSSIQARDAVVVCLGVGGCHEPNLVVQGDGRRPSQPVRPAQQLLSIANSLRDGGAKYDSCWKHPPLSFQIAEPFATAISSKANKQSKILCLPAFAMLANPSTPLAKMCLGAGIDPIRGPTTNYRAVMRRRRRVVAVGS